MKSIDITVSFDDEKLTALSYYLSKEKNTPQKELQNCIVQLYEKHVPADTREYIESRMSSPSHEKVRRPARPEAQKPAAQKAAVPAVPAPVNDIQ
ncbi:DUF6103 family protein [uncultured Oscillibacter sp.]|uniref:DUF6103 family protein n=1 Tax=uncultured Oscillibacter sp. TaxID=876091 RepID=UPI0025D95D0B|nr:DUF6103 family protein [uncultured Oscillibacter sp.]